jgi:hypothetical protein
MENATKAIQKAEIGETIPPLYRETPVLMLLDNLHLAGEQFIIRGAVKSSIPEIAAGKMYRRLVLNMENGRCRAMSEGTISFYAASRPRDST